MALHFSVRSSRRAAVLGVAALAVGLLASCGDSGEDAASAPDASPSVTSTEVTLVTYDSFALSKKTLKMLVRGRRRSGAVRR